MPPRQKILIIEKDSGFRKKVSQKFQKAGYQVFETIQEDAAFEIIEDIKMDLIFFGQSGTGSSPEQFLQKLRRTFSGQRCPLFVYGLQTDSAIAVGPLVEFSESTSVNLDDVLVRASRLIKLGKDAKAIKQAKVLVAGAEDSVVKDMIQQLQNAGYQVAGVGSGSAVITDVVKTLPDVLIMDVLMEGMTSSEIIGVLRQMPQMDGKPILLYSFYRVEDLEREEVRERVMNIEASIQRCKNIGADEYIGRYNETAFMSAIQKYLF